MQIINIQETRGKDQVQKSIPIMHKDELIYLIDDKPIWKFQNEKLTVASDSR